MLHFISVYTVGKGKTDLQSPKLLDWIKFFWVTCSYKWGVQKQINFASPPPPSGTGETSTLSKAW